MSPFDPFRGGGSPKGDNVPFFRRFFIGELPLVTMLVLHGGVGFKWIFGLKTALVTEKWSMVISLDF